MKPDNSKAQSTIQEKVTPIGSTKHDYNTDQLGKFLDTVFHSELNDDEEVLTWICTSHIPGYPISEDKLFTKLERIPIAKSLYYGTSTCTSDPIDNKLYNRKALFSRLHVVVLDDIGTKISHHKLPPELIPSYIIETSEGNFQYGYVLERPIDILEQAEALIQLIHESGFTDGGGKLVTKLVRLPDGCNGKRGPKGAFKVKLHSLSDLRWTPAKILELLDLGITWAEVLDDTAKVVKQRAKHAQGLTPWSPITPHAATCSGLVDPVLEWLYDKGLVKQETNEWATVECPWSDQHTDGGSVAGYSPIGRGDTAYAPYRNFCCFHDHCSGKTGHDFLQWVAANDGPEAAVRDDAGQLLVEYAFNELDGGVVYVHGPAQPLFQPMTAFRLSHPGKVRIMTADGNAKLVAETSLWVTAPNRVKVWGQTYDPTTVAKIVTDKRGLNRVNMFVKPEWGAGDYSKDQADKFYDFIHYLIPNQASADYFLDWLACKVQNMGFRGAGVVMVAKAQGTGRSTMADMLTHMFGTENVARVLFKNFIGSEFNEFMAYPMIISDETLDTGTDVAFYSAYEKVKALIDPRPQEMTINTKYGKKYKQMVYSSTLLFSNHENAIAAAGGDRRLYVLENADTPAPAAYFTELNRWIDKDDGAWAMHVWRWLLERKVDLEKMVNPAPVTAAKQAMLDSSKSKALVAVEAVFSHWPSAVISTHRVKKILQKLYHRLDLTDNADNVIRAVVRDLTLGTSGQVVKIDGAATRLRIIRYKVTPEIRAAFTQEFIGKETLSRTRAEFDSANDDTIREAIEESLQLHDF